MKTTIFCGLIAACLLAGSAIPGSAQNKRWEHNLYEGVGMAKKFDSHDNQTVAFHVGYGINYYLSSKWSVMPGVAIRAKALGTIADIRGTVHRPISMFPCSHNTILAARSVRA